VGGEGSRDVLKLSVEEGSLGASSWGAHGICEGSMVKSYFWGPANERALSATMSILFCAVTRSALMGIKGN